MKCPGIDDEPDTYCENEIAEGASVCVDCGRLMVSITERIAAASAKKSKQEVQRKDIEWEPQRTMYRVLYPVILGMFVMLMEMFRPLLQGRA